MMDIQAYNLPSHFRSYLLTCSEELQMVTAQIDLNLEEFGRKESQRSSTCDYVLELQELKIQIQYPMSREKISQSNCVIELNKSFNILQIVVRHAFALHNYYKRAYNTDDRRIYTPCLMDPPLHYFGRRQCDHLSQVVTDIDFSVVFISPLLRTVQTAQLMFRDHPNKKHIKFVLLPIACEKVSSQYSFYRWGRLLELCNTSHEDGNIQIDMSAFDEYKNKELWQLEMVNKHGDTSYDLDMAIDAKEYFKKYFNTFNSRTFNQNQERFILENFVKRGKPISIESEGQCYKRGMKIKELMRISALRNRGTPKKVGLISHSLIIKSFFAFGLDEQQKMVRDLSFQLENGNIVPLDLK